MKLIKNITDVQVHLPVSMTSDLYVVAPYLNISERMIARLIGREQFDKLVEFYTTPPVDPETEGNKKLAAALSFAQAIEVNLGYFHAVPVLSVNIGSGGITINSNENTKQAFNWQVTNVRRSLLEVGFNGIENLLELLESDPVVFSEYHASDEFKKHSHFLIRSAAVFSSNFNIGGSRYVFHTISYIMSRVEAQDVVPLFGAGLINALRASAVPEPYAHLLSAFIQPGIALLTAAKALRERVITLENGVATINLEQNYDTAKKELVADKEQLDDMYNQLMADGNHFLSDGMDYVLENIGDFPDFAPPAISRRFNIAADKDKGIWAN